MAERKPRPPVVPGSPLSVHGFLPRMERPGFTGGDLERFKDLFARAWGRVDPGACWWRTARRKRLRAYAPVGPYSPAPTPTPSDR